MLTGLGFFAVLCGGDLPAGQHGAGGLWLHRDSGDDAGDSRPGLPVKRIERGGRTDLRAAIVLRAVVPDSGDGRLEGVAGRACRRRSSAAASFAGLQFFVSNYVGAELVDITSSLAAIASLVILFKLWKPSDDVPFGRRNDRGSGAAEAQPERAVLGVDALFTASGCLRAGLGQGRREGSVEHASLKNIAWPGFAQSGGARSAGTVGKAAPYGAIRMPSVGLSAAGTACVFATILAAALLRVSP
jgi:hypothetical protein